MFGFELLELRQMGGNMEDWEEMSPFLSHDSAV